ncbi:hypothetical protein DPMN_046982 [Dreissena polymorpha]|uniref:Uncharacterized protein n=1 Tax=Dreissena polymorpha TaxID=45954 RepID=A0A9D4D7W7_DREPO|nr:hypothetical protein DPMN_046982 [Dreissena polymorpha]
MNEAQCSQNEAHFSSIFQADNPVIECAERVRIQREQFLRQGRLHKRYEHSQTPYLATNGPATFYHRK